MTSLTNVIFLAISEQTSLLGGASLGEIQTKALNTNMALGATPMIPPGYCMQTFEALAEVSSR